MDLISHYDKVLPPTIDKKKLELSGGSRPVSRPHSSLSTASRAGTPENRTPLRSSRGGLNSRGGTPSLNHNISGENRGLRGGTKGPVHRPPQLHDKKGSSTHSIHSSDCGCRHKGTSASNGAQESKADNKLSWK